MAEREETAKADLEVSDELAKAFERATALRTMLETVHQKKWEKSFAQVQHNFGRLSWWMQRGLDRDRMRSCVEFYLACLQTDFRKDNYTAKDIEQMISGRATPEALIALPTMDASANMLLTALPAFATHRFSALLFATVTNLQLSFRVSAASESNLEAGFDRDNWQLFWRLFNLLQLVGDSPPELQLIGDGIGASLTLTQLPPATPSSRPQPVPEPASPAAENVLDYYDEEYHDLVRTLLDRGIDFEREGSYILKNDKNVTVAEAVIGLPDQGLVFGPLDEASEHHFQSVGLRVLTPTEFSIELLYE